MSTQTTIESKLTEGFSPSFLAVENESHGHNVAQGAETHFKVVLVSEVFLGQAKVKRHQAIYSSLAEELQSGVHALALHLYTPEEWSQRSAAPESPACMGGSKK